MRSPFAIAVAVLLAVWMGPVRADIFIVVNASNPVQTMSQKEALDLYMGRSRAFPNADFALAFDLPRDNAVRDRFYHLLTGMNQAQVNSYWSRLMFTGQTLPPQPLPTEAALHDMVKRNPSAIGYLGQPPADKGLRVVLVLKEAS
jgi:hypothetical protein